MILRILLSHNFLRPPSGENAVFDAEKELLLANAVEVTTYQRSNIEIENTGCFKKITLPFDVVWSLKSYKDIKNIIKRHKPDVAHFHNIFPFISPSAYFACKELGIPVVQTLHNHRLFCPGGYFLRSGVICKECVEKGLWRSVKSACYRNSRIQTAGFATMLYIHRKLGTWEKKVDCYVTLTNFAKDLYINAGLPKEKVTVKPNFVKDFGEYQKGFDQYGVFVGRLGVEKGVESLILALKKVGNINFKIVGDGPIRSKLENLKSKLNLSSVDFCGYKKKEDTISIIRSASFLVLPAIWYEGFPMVILEAMSLGKPVITTNLGGLSEIVKNGYNGFLVPPGDTDALAEKIKLLSKDRALCEHLGQNARKEYEAKYTPERNYEMLMDIYKKVLNKP